MVFRNIYNYVRLFTVVSIILTNVIQYHIFPLSLSQHIYIHLARIVVFLLNLKTRVHGNTDYLNSDTMLIMGNHYDGFDFFTLFDLYHRHNHKQLLYVIVKSDIVECKDNNNILSELFYLINNAFLNSSHFIPYKRGDRQDGKIVKEIILDNLYNNKNILIFPEGTTRTNGIPKDFKHGIFQLTIENKVNILPITLKYKGNVGVERGEPIILFNWFDNEVDIFIHDLITPEKEESYVTKDFLELKSKVYEIICSPFD